MVQVRKWMQQRIWSSDLLFTMSREPLHHRDSPTILPSRSSFFKTMLLLELHVFSNLLNRYKLLRQLHKNAASNTEPVLEAAPDKAAAARLPTTHHKTCPS